MEELIKDKKQQEYDKETRAMLNDIHTNYQFIRLDRELKRLEKGTKNNRKINIIKTIIFIVAMLMLFAILQKQKTNDYNNMKEKCEEQNLVVGTRYDSIGYKYYVCEVKR